MTIPYARSHENEFAALERGDSDWSIYRARIADTYGPKNVNKILSLWRLCDAIDMATKSIEIYWAQLQRSDLSAEQRRRTERNYSDAERSIDRLISQIECGEIQKRKNGEQ